MRAVTCEASTLSVANVPDATPERGQLALEVEACGICGSDLHARTHGEEMAADAAAAGYDGFMRANQSVVLGHEFSGTVADHGPKTRKRIKSGTPVVAFPLLRSGGQIHTTGLSEHAPGGYAEQVVVEQSLTIHIPNGLSLRTAALTEPMAVALHAVRRGEVGKNQVAYVIGCGPIGLGVIAMLKATGVRTVVASDLSPGRRALATKMGADVVVDPALNAPFDEHGEKFHTASSVFELAVGTMEKLRAVPKLPWWRVLQAADKTGASPSGPVVFECVGVPGMINAMIADAPLYSRVVVVGVCMGADQVRPSIAINKEIDLRFVLGYTPDEFRAALHLMAEGKVDPSPLITGTVGLDGVAGAFTDLSDPETHAKILITPNDPAGATP